jgi:hypothetical protein
MAPPSALQVSASGVGESVFSRGGGEAGGDYRSLSLHHPAP